MPLAGPHLEPAYEYIATLQRGIDGDTYDLNLDLGFEITAVITVRLHGYNCPELPTPEGVKAAEAARALLANRQFLVKTYKGPRTGTDRKSFARWVADVYLDAQHLGALLDAQGLAKRL